MKVSEKSKREVDRLVTDLYGVPKTMLWTLYNRASEAKRDDRILDDPWSVEILDSIDYDFPKYFGEPDASHAVRSAIFDHLVKDFLSVHPSGLIVSLGEGLETQLRRCENGKRRWLSIDLPDVIEIRKRFIPQDARAEFHAGSVLDLKWLEALEDEPVLIVAQGLFMYFQPDEVRKILFAIDNKFSRCAVIFDTIPHWFSRKTLNGFKKTPAYTVPEMPWGIDRDEIPDRIKCWAPNTRDLQVLDFQFPRGTNKWLFKFWNNTPILRNRLPAIVRYKKGWWGLSSSTNRLPWV